MKTMQIQEQDLQLLLEDFFDSLLIECRNRSDDFDMRNLQKDIDNIVHEYIEAITIDATE